MMMGLFVRMSNHGIVITGQLNVTKLPTRIGMARASGPCDTAPCSLPTIPHRTINPFADANDGSPMPVTLNPRGWPRRRPAGLARQNPCANLLAKFSLFGTQNQLGVPLLFSKGLEVHFYFPPTAV